MTFDLPTLRVTSALIIGFVGLLMMVLNRGTGRPLVEQRVATASVGTFMDRGAYFWRACPDIICHGWRPGGLVDSGSGAARA